MKPLLKIFAVFFLVLSLTSCKKELAKLEGKPCWKCHIYGMAPNGISYDYTKTVCGTQQGDPPQFSDDYGNSLNSTCTKQ